jgi:hypothetical protein
MPKKPIKGERISKAAEINMQIANVLILFIFILHAANNN